MVCSSYCIAPGGHIWEGCPAYLIDDFFGCEHELSLFPPPCMHMILTYLPVLLLSIENIVAYSHANDSSYWSSPETYSTMAKGCQCVACKNVCPYMLKSEHSYALTGLGEWRCEMGSGRNEPSLPFFIPLPSQPDVRSKHKTIGCLESIKRALDEYVNSFVSFWNGLTVPSEGLIWCNNPCFEGQKCANRRAQLHLKRSVDWWMRFETGPHHCVWIHKLFQQVHVCACVCVLRSCRLAYLSLCCSPSMLEPRSAGPVWTSPNQFSTSPNYGRRSVHVEEDYSNSQHHSFALSRPPCARFPTLIRGLIGERNRAFSRSFAERRHGCILPVRRREFDPRRSAEPGFFPLLRILQLQQGKTTILDPGGFKLSARSWLFSVSIWSASVHLSPHTFVSAQLWRMQLCKCLMPVRCFTL